jgi:Activator of Hsp90 ATPase homolog 1-like protein
VAKMQDPHKGIEFDITIERMEPEKVFSYRWHPGAVDPGVDYSKEPTTLVEFTLEKVADGVQLTVTESGFDQIPLARRAKAFAENEGGWTVVIQLVGKYLEQNA